MQKEIIIQKLKECGYRITKQRLMLLDVILEEECSCCKEIFYRASQRDEKLGAATVYRMINTLEEIGAINRKNMYKIQQEEENGSEEVCIVQLDDDTVCTLTPERWSDVISAGLLACGYRNRQQIKSIVIKRCCCKDARGRNCS